MQWSFRYAFAKLMQAIDVHQAMMRKQMEKFSAEMPTAMQTNEIASRVSAAVSTGVLQLGSQPDCLALVNALLVHTFTSQGFL
jgi:hypothetical protein